MITKNTPSRKETLKNCLQWIADEQYIHDTLKYGTNKRDVEMALRDQKRRVDTIQAYKINTLAHAQRNNETSEVLLISQAYEQLQQSALRRQHCLQQLSKLCQIQDIYCDITSTIAMATCSSLDQCLDEQDVRNESKVTGQSQERILAVQQQWKWIQSLARHSDVHVNNASEYYKFHNEINEYSNSISELNNVSVLQSDNIFFKRYKDAISNLIDRSHRITPIRSRIAHVKEPIIARSMCDFATNEVIIRENEQIFLLDNSSRSSWKIKTLSGIILKMPSVCVLIPGPDTEAVKLAMDLRAKLLGFWTKAIQYTTLNTIDCIRKEIDEEIKKDNQSIDKLSCMSPLDQDALNSFLCAIETKFSEHWSRNENYKKLTSSIDTLRQCMLKEKKQSSENNCSSLIKKCKKILDSHNVFFNEWTIERIKSDTSTDAQLMQMLEHSNDINFAEIKDIVDGWNSPAEMDHADGPLTTTPSSSPSFTPPLLPSSPKDSRPCAVTSQSSQLLLPGEKVTTVQREENTTFYITGVLDPRNNELLSMKQAVKMGIIDNQQGMYVNPETGQKISIPVAMNSSFIKVDCSKGEASKETTRDLGLITVLTREQRRRYVITAALDQADDQWLTADESEVKGVTNATNNTYKTASGEYIDMQEAIDQRVVEVEYDQGPGSEVTEVGSEVTYAVHGVCDVLGMCTLPYAEAVKTGILDERTGNFRNSLTSSEMNVVKAIARGFIKAVKVENGDGLDIPFENRMFVENIKKIQQKIIKPLTVICALKSSVSPQLSPMITPTSAQDTPTSALTTPIPTLTPITPLTPLSPCSVGSEACVAARSTPVTPVRDTPPCVRYDLVGRMGYPAKATSMCSLTDGGGGAQKRTPQRPAPSPTPSSSYAKHTQSSSCKIKIDRPKP